MKEEIKNNKDEIVGTMEDSFDEEEEKEIKKRLKELGYLD